MSTLVHTPVLVREIMEYFAPDNESRLLDATLGLGGHTRAFLEAAGPGSTAVGLDADEHALETARHNLQEFGDRITFLHQNFARLPDGEYTHILFDLGIGSHQLQRQDRGFSFQDESELDMRYGAQEYLPDAQVDSLNMLQRKLNRFPTAHDIVMRLNEQEFAEVLRTYGEERMAGRVARVIKDVCPQTASQLAQAAVSALPKGYERGRIHPATRTFQALRLAVNRELEVLALALRDATDKIVPEGKIAVISFHSLEDRIVKRYFAKESRSCICPPEQVVCICNHTARLDILTKKPVTPSVEEVRSNPRARSAKLRVAMRKRV